MNDLPESLPKPGARLGEYVIEDLIGTGGMGAVFAARHVQLGVLRALKVQTVGSEGYRERFAREARALAKVDSHPNVVGVHEYGFAGDGATAYVVMDLVEGPDLAEAIHAQGALPLERVYRIGAALADALAHIHAAGIVHRDLKPGNVLLRADDDQPQLTDFGLAWDASESDGERLTATGHVLGTLQYMSPEQTAGRRDIGPASDVFALASVLYEALTGQAAFSGATYMELVARIDAQSYVPLRRARPEAPSGVADLLSWMFERDPDDRPSAREVAEALALAARGEQLVIDVPSARRTPLVAALVALVVLVAGVGAALWARRERAAPAPEAAATEPGLPQPTPAPDPAAERAAERRAVFTAALEAAGGDASAGDLLVALRPCRADPAARSGEVRALGQRLVRAVLSFVVRNPPPANDLIALLNAAAAIGEPLGRDPILKQVRPFLARRYVSLRGKQHGELFVAYVRLDMPMEFMGTMFPGSLTGVPSSPASQFLRLHRPAYSFLRAREPARRKLLAFLESAEGRTLGDVTRAHGLSLAAGVQDHAVARHLALAEEAYRLDPGSPCGQAGWAMALARAGRAEEARRVAGAIQMTPMIHGSWLFHSLRCWTHVFCGERDEAESMLVELRRAGAPPASLRLLREELARVLRFVLERRKGK